MKYNFKKTSLFVIALVVSILTIAQTQCCDIPTCKEKAQQYAQKLAGHVFYLGKCVDENDPDFRRKNDSVLNELKNNHRNIYDDFIRSVKDVADLYIDNPKIPGSQLCFLDALPKGTGSNVMAWINFIRNAKPVFPSTEFCGGLKKRFEIGQGATAFLDKTSMAYLGALKGFLIYTFFKKGECGGRVRLMAGPGLHLLNADAFGALNSRLGLRLKDIKASVFSLGNINLFGGYTTNFDKFNYAELGLEVELGRFGFNLAGNYDTENKNGGFMISLILANKRIGK